MSGNTIDLIEGPSESGSLLLPCYPCEITPEGTAVVVDDPTLHQITENGENDLWRPVTSPELATSLNERQKRSGSANSLTRPPKKSRRFRKSRKIDNINIFSDSGSDSKDDLDFVEIRKYTRRLRDHIIEENESLDFLENRDWDLEVENVPEREIDNEIMTDESNDSVNVLSERNVNERIRGCTKKAGKSTAAAPVGANFSWSEDFSLFKGQKESYSRVPGPTFSSQDPAAIFLEIWDREFMENVVRNTNKYVCEVERKISQLSDLDLIDPGAGILKDLDSWTNVTVEELYRYFAILLLLPLCQFQNIREYWCTGVMEIPGIRSIMTFDRFSLINKFLHFVSDEDLLTRGHDRKIEKVAPVVDLCNRKFAAMYTPSQYLNVEESLLLGKSRANLKQWSKAARFGIKYFELCEAETGYLLQYRLYADKGDEMHPDATHGLLDTAPIVLDLLEGYLDVGHVLVFGNWYNQLPLTRHLKTRCTDVLAMVNRRREGIPPAIKNLTPNDVDRGSSVSRHCGDIALVAYKNVQIITITSTYHQHGTFLGTRVGPATLMPEVVQEFNRYKGGVDLKDRKLSKFPMERHSNKKWYMKVFRRLLNTSLLNAFIIYTKNPMYVVSSNHDFRLEVAEGLLSRYPSVSSVPCTLSNTPRSLPARLLPGQHFPIHTEFISGSKKGKRKRLRCVRCAALNRRFVTICMCLLCQVPLCLKLLKQNATGHNCFEDYHSVLNLEEVVNVDG